MKKIVSQLLEPKSLISANFLYFLVFLFVSIVITSILSLKYFSFQNIVENGISKKQIVAKKTIEVVDTQKTELIKRDIASKIKPVVMPIDEGYVKASLQGFEDSVIKIRSSKASYNVKESDLEDILDISDIQKERQTVRYLLLASPSHLSSMFANTDRIIDVYLKTGVTENEIENYTNENSISNLLGGVNKSQVRSISGIIEHVMLPNLIVDEYATDVARKNAKSMVKPYTVIIKKGDTIVKPGELLTQVKKDALRKSGYNPLELNKGGVAGIFLLTIVSMVGLLLYVKKYERKFLTLRYMLIIASFAIMLVYLCVNISSSNYLSNYLMPIPAFTIIIAVFTSPILAFLATVLVLSLLSLTLFLEPQLFTVFVFGILVAAYSVSNICYTKRFDLIKCGFQVGVMGFITVIIVSLFESQFGIFETNPSFGNAIAAFMNGLLSGIIALGVLPIVENIFKIVTPYGLIELADHNQTLLSNLQYKAPGTYHHSLMVANLCEAAAEAIGANPILARVGAFYHDIGKLKRPLFFIENQSYFGIENPHSKLNPRLSKMVITSHAKDGVELAKEYGLPQVIINFIQQHHGEALAGHFYSQAVAIEGKENVQEEQFRYPGPKPNMKETAILMLADAVESAVRSLKNPTQEEIENMINRIITERLNDGQLSDSPLTLKDIKLIALTFNRILRGMQHDRIKYQQLNEFEDRNRIKLEASKEEKLEKRIQKKQQQQKNADAVEAQKNIETKLNDKNNEEC